MQHHEIIIWVRKALKADDYIDFKVEIEGKNSATEGYTSDMVFAKITLVGEDKKYKVLNLAFKFGKKALMRVPIFKNVYRREMYFYKDLLEMFTDLQNGREVDETFNILPKCYTTLSEDQMEIIVLENVSKIGYELHKRDLTMNIHHFKVVFKAFAKLHALSFALKEKKEELFNEAAKQFPSTNDFFTQMTEFFTKKPMFVVRNLLDAQRDDLAKKFKKLIEPGIINLLSDILNDNVDNAAIVHADCHCNNFMFQYRKGDKENPTNVAILDWQCAKVHSPAIDLSYFFYCEGSKKELAEQPYLLKYYYENFSIFLKELGCDAEKLFPFSSLLDHWKKYSFYGFIYACCYMDFSYFDDDTTPELDPEKDMADVFSNVQLKNPELCRDRLVEIVEHYFESS